MKKTDEKKMFVVTIDDYATGWVFYKTNGVHGGNLKPFEDDDLIEFMKGFCTAQADYDSYPDPAYPSIQDALIDLGIDEELLERCLQATEIALTFEEWCRWPDVPVRTQAKKINTRYLIAANDEVG